MLLDDHGAGCEGRQVCDQKHEPNEPSGGMMSTCRQWEVRSMWVVVVRMAVRIVLVVLAEQQLN